MLFSSMTFLFVFMPLVMAVYFLSKKEIRNYVLLIASIIFYAWGEPRYLAIMIITILVNYAGAILLDKHYSSRQRLWIVSLTIVLDLSFLFSSILILSSITLTAFWRRISNCWTSLCRSAFHFIRFRRCRI